MMADADREQLIARLVLAELERQNLRVIPEGVRSIPGTPGIPVGVSVRHIHLSRFDVDRLFGEAYQLTELKPISQPGQFAAAEQVTLIGSNGRRLERVRIIGPERAETQVELSRTDAIVLGLSPPVRMSGFLEDTPGITIEFNGRQIEITRGVIIAARHIHMTPEEGIVRNLANGDIVQIRVEGDKGGVMDNIHVAIHDRCTLDFHIDTDDANAFGLSSGQIVELSGYKWRRKQ